MYKIGKIHGHIKVIKVIDNKPHIPSKKKGKWEWIETIIETKRLKKFRAISDCELIEMLH